MRAPLRWSVDDTPVTISIREVFHPRLLSAASSSANHPEHATCTTTAGHCSLTATCPINHSVYTYTRIQPPDHAGRVKLSKSYGNTIARDKRKLYNISEEMYNFSYFSEVCKHVMSFKLLQINYFYLKYLFCGLKLIKLF